jgi:hypothetical protein
MGAHEHYPEIRRLTSICRIACRSRNYATTPHGAALRANGQIPIIVNDVLPSPPVPVGAHPNYAMAAPLREESDVTATELL